MARQDCLLGAVEANEPLLGVNREYVTGTVINEAIVRTK